MQPVVFVVNPNQQYLESASVRLAEAGYVPAVWSEWTQAHALICMSQPSVVVLDLPADHVGTSLALLRQLQRDTRTRQIPVVLTVADERLLASHDAWLYDSGCHVVSTPCDVDDLLVRLRLLQFGQVLQSAGAAAGADLVAGVPSGESDMHGAEFLAV